jgi:phosphoglycolate phosphatase
MPAPAFIFDLDGTLVDSRHDLATAVNLMRRDLSLPGLPVDTVAGFVGDGIRLLVERVLFDAPSATRDVAQALALLKKHYAEHLMDQTVLYPGVLAGLEALSRRQAHLAIVTNKPTEPARRICAGLGILRFFPHVLGGDACAKTKPDPFPVLQILTTTGADPATSWMIGDNTTDLEAGRRAGIRRCFCRFGFGQAGTEVADLSVDSFAEFADYVLSKA